MSGLNGTPRMKVPVQFTCQSAEVLNLVGQALKQRNGNVPQVYADLLSALMTFSILNDRPLDEISGHVFIVAPDFHRLINADKDGLAASVGLFKTPIHK